MTELGNVEGKHIEMFEAWDGHEKHGIVILGRRKTGSDIDRIDRARERRF